MAPALHDEELNQRKDAHEFRKAQNLMERNETHEPNHPAAPPDPSMRGMRNDPAPPRTPEQRDKDRSGYDPESERSESRK